MRLVIKADEVPVERIDAYRRLLDQFLNQTTWRLYLPWSEKRDSSFPVPPTLPSTSDMSSYVPAADINDFEDFCEATTPSAVSARPLVQPKAAESFWNTGGKFLIPLIVVISFAARNINTSSYSGSSYSSPAPAPSPSYRLVNPPLNSDPITFFANNKSGSNNALLASSPPVIGPVFNAREVDQVAEVTSQALPKYPVELRAQGVEGEAVIEFTVTDAGFPANITVVKATNTALGTAASIAVSQWTFRAAVKDGRHVNMTMRAPFSFKLSP